MFLFNRIIELRRILLFFNIRLIKIVSLFRSKLFSVYFILCIIYANDLLKLIFAFYQWNECNFFLISFIQKHEFMNSFMNSLVIFLVFKLKLFKNYFRLFWIRIIFIPKHYFLCIRIFNILDFSTLIIYLTKISFINIGSLFEIFFVQCSMNWKFFCIITVFPNLDYIIFFQKYILYLYE